MTISATLARVQYNGNSVTTNFTWAARILTTADLKVVTLDTTDPHADPITKVLTTDYTVTGAGTSSATVIFNVVPATGILVTILLNLPLTQTADYTDNDPFPAQTHENALDKLTLIEQQQNDQITRSVKFPETADISLVATLPPVPVDNACIVWDGAAGAMKNGPDIGSLDALITTIQGYVTTCAADVVLTHADVVLTHADVVLTHADVVTANAAAAAALAAVGAVKVTTSDTTPGVLNVKLLSGNPWLTKTTGSPGGNETLTLKVEPIQEADSTPSSGTVTLNMTAGHYRKITPSGNFTVALTQISGKPCSYIMEIVNGGAVTVTHPTGTKWDNGTAPILTTSGADLICYIMNSAGVIRGVVLGQNFS